MNRYGAMAQRYWQQWLPEQYASMTDPDGFFSALGEEVARQIDELADELAGTDRLGDGYLAQVGRLMAARAQAEEVVLREQRRAHAILAETYNLAQFFLAYQPAADLLWRVAERAIATAQESDEPYAIGASVWLLAQAHRDAGEFEVAEDVNRQGLELLRPRMDDAPARLRGIWGALLFEVAYTAARAGERGRAWGYWDQANDVAQRLPAAFYDPMTSFSRIIMGAHAMTVAVESRQGGESRRQARRTAHLAIPSQPRRGRHLIEVARGYHLANDLKTALGTLDSAYKTAPETIRYNGYARKILFELATEGPADLRRDANGLADRIGMLV
jgi:tetratricopeptide (TPR) repeat protein